MYSLRTVQISRAWWARYTLFRHSCPMHAKSSKMCVFRAIEIYTYMTTITNVIAAKTLRNLTAKNSTSAPCSLGPFHVIKRFSLSTQYEKHRFWEISDEDPVLFISPTGRSHRETRVSRKPKEVGHNVNGATWSDSSDFPPRRDGNYVM